MGGADRIPEGQPGPFHIHPATAGWCRYVLTEGDRLEYDRMLTFAEYNAARREE